MMFTENLRAQFGNDALPQSHAHEWRTAFTIQSIISLWPQKTVNIGIIHNVEKHILDNFNVTHLLSRSVYKMRSKDARSIMNHPPQVSHSLSVAIKSFWVLSHVN